MLRPCILLLLSLFFLSLLGSASPAADDAAKVDSDRAVAALRRLRAKQQHEHEASARPATRPTNRPATRPAGKCVVFILDGSGSMKPGLQAARDEIYKGVANLPDDSSFNVFVARFRETRAFSKTPVRPTPTIVENLGKFLDRVEATGTGDDTLLHLVDGAFRAHADLVWLVSDGDFDNPLRAIELAHATSARYGGRLNTLFTGEGSAATAARVMASIAQAGHGRCLDLAGRVIAASEEPKPDNLVAASRPSTRPNGPSIFDLTN